MSLPRTLTRTLRSRPTLPSTTTHLSPIQGLLQKRTVKISASAVAQDPTPSASHASAPSFQSPPPPRSINTTTTTTQSTEESHIESLISTHPITQSLRQNPLLTESRPHRTIPLPLRQNHLVAGTLSGPTRLTVPPYVWATSPSTQQNQHQSTTHTIFHIGGNLGGHPGYVHGGLLTVMFDEAFARCVSASLTSGLGMTANLNVDFRKPGIPGRLFLLKAETVKVEGRKAWVRGDLTMLKREGADAVAGEEDVVVAEGRALFVEPKFADSIVPLYRN
ncbi:PaaI family thioesterase [Aspergillus candidus]|uniref:HotDog domain-containing protein n=1 Tax=Aspergillus candidus TaxID=41067 RepID=A0A2I2FG71_ASPCN|nr:HotDog domain-containing protein [Aspergillus candidus]PLB39611.1 HotDog domain-containing protein [Aspergillus candidus]